MKFLVISDLHAHNDVLDKMDAQFKEADGVLFAGDFAECFIIIRIMWIFKRSNRIISIVERNI